MTIAIPLDEKGLESSVCLSFGRAPYLLLYDTEAKTSRFIDNEAAASQGGAGIKAAQSVVDNGAEALFTHRCGMNSKEVLSRSGIRIFKAQQGTAQQNIEFFTAGKLEILGEFHAGPHDHAE